MKATSPSLAPRTVRNRRAPATAKIRRPARPSTSMVCYSDPPSPRVLGDEPRLSAVDLLLSIFGVAVLTAALSFWVWMKMSQVQAGYDLFAMQQRLVELQQTQQALRVERTSLLRPERLDALARNILNMAPPEKAQVIRLGELKAGGGAK